MNCSQAIRHLIPKIDRLPVELIVAIEKMETKINLMTAYPIIQEGEEEFRLGFKKYGFFQEMMKESLC